MSDIAEKLRERPWRHGGETDVQAKERRQKEREEGAAEIERLTARTKELEQEIEQLRDPRLSHMRLENGSLDMSLVSPVIEGLATALGGWFVAGGAKNYAEMRLHDRHETGAVYIVTVQKAGAKTPHQLRTEAEGEASRLTARVAELEGALKKLYAAYVGTLEAGRDRIIALGGDCDPVDVMEKGDPAMSAARAAITKGESRD